MIGFYDYTVILTYLSLMSGTIGIMLCLNGMGHPYLGMFFLLFSGLCDTFDGKVARTKKDRTPQMKKFNCIWNTSGMHWNCDASIYYVYSGFIRLYKVYSYTL